jgi:hypothetical protein
MRHLVGVLLAIFMAAAVFFVASWGYLKLLTSPNRGGGPSSSAALLAGGASLLHNHAVLEGFGALLAVGLLAGVLIALPMISPLASGLPGLVLLAWTGLYLFSVRRAVQYIPFKTQAYGAGFQAMLFDGVLALLGAAMIIPLFVPSRWRSRPAAIGPAQYEAPATTYPDLGAIQTIAGGSFMSDWAETRPQPPADAGRSQAPWGPAEPSGPADQESTADSS